MLITGGTGTLGSAIIRKLQNVVNCEISVFSRDEYKQHLHKKKFTGTNIRYIIGDIRNPATIRSAIRYIQPDIIFNTAALKHIDLSEVNPYEYVQTNIMGVQNLIDAVLDIGQNCKMVLSTSTDKAVAPVNVMGMTKAIQERLMIDANSYGNTKFLCSRYGNVISSRGSLVEIILACLKEDIEIPLTDPECSRFFLSIEDGVKLIMSACENPVPGAIYIPKMKSFMVIDVINHFIEKSGKAATIKNIGMRPGERKYEVIVSNEEGARTVDVGDYYIIMPPEKVDQDTQYINRAITTTDTIIGYDEIGSIFGEI